MTSQALALALGGWSVAAAALAALALTRRALALRMEAVARASHEVRGPLTAVRLGLERGAMGGPLSVERLRAIDLELSRATRALDELQGVGSSQPHCGPLKQPLDVSRLLSDSVEAWRASAEASGVTLTLDWAGPSVAIVGDRVRLAQATGNLIANAIEHGGGRVEVRGRADQGTIRVQVLDDGPGLSAPVAELARGADPARPRGHGLRIALAVAAAHGGRLAAAPSERGARLVLELPAAGPAERGRAERV